MDATATERRDIFAVIEHARVVWAVAAIHGERERLRALHEAIGERLDRGDRLVYLGNYLGYGPDIAGTIDELLTFRRDVLMLPGAEPQDIVFLRGAQEEMWQKLLQIQFAVDPGSVLAWLLEHGVGSTLKAYGGDPEAGRRRFREGALAITRWTGELRANIKAHPGHDALLGSLRRAAYTDSGGLLFVHAGVDPSRPLSEQGDALWWGSGYFSAIEAAFEGFARVVRGYDRDHGGARFGDYTATIDAGCGFGGPLMATCFAPDGSVVEKIQF